MSGAHTEPSNLGIDLYTQSGTFAKTGSCFCHVFKFGRLNGNTFACVKNIIDVALFDHHGIYFNILADGQRYLNLFGRSKGSNEGCKLFLHFLEGVE